MDKPRPVQYRLVTSRRAALAVVAILAVLTSSSFLLGYLYGVTQPQNPLVVVGGRVYHAEIVSIPIPSLGSNESAPSSFTFRNVTFAVWLAAWFSPAGGQLHGNGTEASGQIYPFVLPGLPPSPSSEWQTYISPDGVFGLQWNGGGTVQLLVSG